jgi:arginyl-tRNA synthetase
LRYNITFHRWFAESGLHDSGAVEDTVALLTERGFTYEKDGALWLRMDGAEKDEVLRRSNGFFTYFAADLAYHRDKFARGFHEAVNILGADHHGHTLRFAKGLEALGLDSSRLRFVLLQLVSLTRGGQAVKMSKRTGNAVTLADLLDEIPRDAARFFFNMRRAGARLDFDLDLAVQTTADNPVYYVQYAHARLCSLLAAAPEPAGHPDAAPLVHPAERELLRRILMFPEEVALAAEEYEPSRVNRFLMELAGSLHRFYDACPVARAPEPERSARVYLCRAARQTLNNGLLLIGVDAPEKM